MKRKIDLNISEDIFFNTLSVEKRMKYYQYPEFIRKIIRGNFPKIYKDYADMGCSYEKFFKEVIAVGYNNYKITTIINNLMPKCVKLYGQLRTDAVVGKGYNKATYTQNTSVCDPIALELLKIFAKYVNEDIFIITDKQQRISCSVKFAEIAMQDKKIKRFCKKHKINLETLSNFYKTVLKLDNPDLSKIYERFISEKGFEKVKYEERIPQATENDFKDAWSIITTNINPNYSYLQFKKDVYLNGGIAKHCNRLFKLAKELRMNINIQPFTTFNCKNIG